MNATRKKNVTPTHMRFKVKMKTCGNPILPSNIVGAAKILNNVPPKLITALTGLRIQFIIVLKMSVKTYPPIPLLIPDCPVGNCPAKLVFTFIATQFPYVFMIVPLQSK
jgi:hypothetical protein